MLPGYAVPAILGATELRDASERKVRRWERTYDEEMRAYEIAYAACQVVQVKDNLADNREENEYDKWD